MRSLALVLFATLVLCPAARGTDWEASAPTAGFKQKLVADTVPATLAKKRTVSEIFATVKITAELGEDE